MEGEGLMGSSHSVYLEGAAAACGVPDEAHLGQNRSHAFVY